MTSFKILTEYQKIDIITLRFIRKILEYGVVI